MADVLRVLAVSRSSGALEVRGRRSGTFFLLDGEITYAEALGIPAAEEFDAADPRLRSTIQSSIVEVGLNLLAEENVGGERPLFRPGRRHWSGRAIHLRVESLLSEIADRLANFTKLGVEPDDEIRLCELPIGRSAVLNRQQWALAAQLSGLSTARSLARRTGTPLCATIETLASLVWAGLAVSAPRVREPPIREPPIREPPAQELPSRQPSTREPLSREPWIREPPIQETASRASPVRERLVREWPARESGPPEVRLPQRIRGATALPPPTPKSTAKLTSKSSSETRHRTPPPSDDAAERDRALALRLLEGLRRL